LPALPAKLLLHVFVKRAEIIGVLRNLIAKKQRIKLIVQIVTCLKKLKNILGAMAKSPIFATHLRKSAALGRTFLNCPVG
jgi:hypothetical protein